MSVAYENLLKDIHSHAHDVQLARLWDVNRELTPMDRDLIHAIVVALPALLSALLIAGAAALITGPILEIRSVMRASLQPGARSARIASDPGPAGRTPPPRPRSACAAPG